MRYPTERPARRWEVLEPGQRWQWEYATACYVMLAPTGEADVHGHPTYMAWLQAGAVPARDDIELGGVTSLADAQRAALYYLASELSDQLHVVLQSASRA